ncbi:FHA domain-containing protein [Pseudarthrobacter sulfonivorans]|uniref:FHA domain-containing protein n=1 Tax=Pseudarthrobacter sulfonivorans TaxID=121292 RepID=UPI00278035B5|nr:FHA domain-containing protein [Pseudarthrobacter sulfonivorans]MDP9998021.1 hypothetical protein [Pseudarthrobacter sulfonivorans]
MATVEYTTGAWLGLLRSRTAVFLGPETPPALVRSLWDLLEDAPEVHEVLHAVTSSFGVSLAQIPSFGIVDYRDELRVFLRGDLDLTVQLPGGPVELNGRDVTTWAERRLDLPQWYRLTVAGEAPAGPALPLTEGVVLLQSLTVALTDAPADAPAAAPVVLAAAGLEAAGPDAAVSSDPAVPSDPAVVPAADVAPAPPVADLPAVPESGPEASAETVMALDDDAHYDAETPEPEQQAVAAGELAEVPQDGGLSEFAGRSQDNEPSHTIEPSHADQVPAHELTGTYDHLWEKTVVRRIEDAAVRDEPDEADAGAPRQEDTPAPAAEPDAPEAINLVPPAPAQHAPMPLPGAIPATGPGGGLIDSVPWRTSGGSLPAAQVPPSFEPSVQVPAHAPVQPQAHAPKQPPVPDAGAGSADAAGFDGDHDGHTIMKSDLAGMAASPAPAAETDAGTGPLVLARVCDRGHANPPTHAQCSACSLPLPSDAVQVARPRLGRMRVSTGELVDLDQSLVIGRQPSVSRVQGGVMPRLVQVSSPSGDISRSHVEVRLEGWHVMLCDLKATNGTVLVREGQQPRRLAQNEMAILLDGDIAELGDDVSLRFEEIL